MDLPEPDDRLNSWKEIAAFLGRTVRTVQRWEKTEGLPLRRGGPGRRGAVVASKREISDWWEGRRRALQPSDVDRESLDTTPSSDPPRPASGRRRLWHEVLPGLIVVLAILTAVVLPMLRRVDTTAASPPRMGRLLAAATTEGGAAWQVALSSPPSGLALSPSGDLAYVALSEEHAIVVVNLGTRTIVDRLAVVERPTKLTVSSDGTRLVINGSSEVGVVDLQQRRLSRFHTGDGTIQDAYLSPDDRFLWLTLAQAGLKILDLDTGHQETIPTVGCPMRMTTAPRSHRVFVSHQCTGPGARWGHDAIEVFDEISRKPIVARSGPPMVGSQLAVSPDEQHLWVDASDACDNPQQYDGEGCPSGSGPVLHALRADTLDRLLTVRVPAETFNTLPIFFPDGTRLVLAGPHLAVIERARGTTYESIDTAAGGWAAFTPDAGSFVVLESRQRRLLKFDLSPPQDTWVLRDAATYWTADGTANDVVGGTHAAATNEVRFAPGRFGRAFSFDTDSGGIDFGWRLDADIVQNDRVTYAAWIKPRPTGVPVHIASRTSLAGWRWSITKEMRLAFCFTDAFPELSCERGELIGRTPLHSDQWVHVAVVRRGGTLTLFVNGHADGVGTFVNGERRPAPGAEPLLRLAAGPDQSAPFRGLIDEVLLFGRALSGDDLAHVMRASSLAR